MSLVFNAIATDFKGIVQVYEKELGFQRGDISGDSNKIKELTVDVNLTWDDYMAIALPSSGTWQYDDSNHTKFPIIKTNIVSGQRDYTFTTDEQGNLILDIYRVAILPTATETLFQEVHPVDVQTDAGASGILTENTNTGVPFYYDKTANGIFLDPIPGYNATNGLKIYINREANYFVSGDTTKLPGCPGIHHRYFAIKPALDYARRNSLSVEGSLRNEVLLMESAIEAHFSKRERDIIDRLLPDPITYQ